MPAVKKNKISADKGVSVKKTGVKAGKKSLKAAKLVPLKVISTGRKTTLKKISAIKTIKPKKVAQPIAVDVMEEDFIPLNEVDKLPDFHLDGEPEFSGETRSEDYHISSASLPDQKEKYFASLAQEIKHHQLETPGDEESEKAQSKHQQIKKTSRLYRRLAIKFIVLTAFLLAVIAYFSFSKLTIYITPKTEDLNASLNVTVSGGESSDSQSDSSTEIINITTAVTSDEEEMETSGANNPRVKGDIREIKVSAVKTYEVKGGEVVGQEIKGKVKLINNYLKDQPLVAKTRLLSPDNKLFRLKNAVLIPAGGEVEAEIYSDEASPELAISATRFIIPGLWAGLQDKIYAESEEAFIYQDQRKSIVKSEDLESARQEMDGLLMAKAKEQVLNNFDDKWALTYQLDPKQSSTTADAKSGDLKTEFTLKSEATVLVIAVLKDPLEKLLQARLSLDISDDKELISFNKEAMTYSLEGYDASKKEAILKIQARGFMSLKADSRVIDRGKLINLSRDQIKEYLNNFPEISAYELKFSPSFISKAPSLVDRIKIEIQAPKN